MLGWNFRSWRLGANSELPKTLEGPRGRPKQEFRCFVRSGPLECRLGPLDFAPRILARQSRSEMWTVIGRPTNNQYKRLWAWSFVVWAFANPISPFSSRYGKMAHAASTENLYQRYRPYGFCIPIGDPIGAPFARCFGSLAPPMHIAPVCALRPATPALNAATRWRAPSSCWRGPAPARAAPRRPTAAAGFGSCLPRIQPAVWLL